MVWQSICLLLLPRLDFDIGNIGLAPLLPQYLTIVYPIPWCGTQSQGVPEYYAPVHTRERDANKTLVISGTPAPDI